MRTSTPSSALSRARGALAGLALGDALGMPTQAMSPTQIAETYGWVDSLRDGDPSQPYAPGMPAGHVTDDTEQALLVADLLVDGAGHIDPLAFAHTLLTWEDDMRARGSLDLLGPSTKAALEQVRAGADPLTMGGEGTTNGSSMRVTPIGIATALDDPEVFAERVWESCRVTHGSTLGFRAAALVAAAVSLGIEGNAAASSKTSSLPEGASPANVSSSLAPLVEQALSYVEALPAHGAWVPNADICARTHAACALAEAAARDRVSDETFADLVRTHIGVSVASEESIPAAFALVWRYADDPWTAVCVAANLGGDTDTIGAIAGAILGAVHGWDAWPDGVCQQVESVSGIDLAAAAGALLDLRTSA